MLAVGDGAGTAIVGELQAGDPRPLAEALAAARRELNGSQTRTAVLERDANRVSAAMSKVQEVLDHITEIAEGRIEAETLGQWADELIGWLTHLDPDEHWQERLRVLRTLVVLLALLGRWLELAQSLSDALHAAERLGDEGAQAWVMHELGTLHLAAEQHPEADDQLSQALELRARAGDAEGVRATEANLRALCKMLRSQLHQAPADEPPSPEPTNGGRIPTIIDRLLRRPLLIPVLSLAFLAAGGLAGATISRDPGMNLSHLAVAIESVPATPRIGEPVVFRAVAKNRADPNDYSWLFGDGEGSRSASPTHVYGRPGRYLVTVAARSPDGAAIGAKLMVTVRSGRSPLEPGPPTASFSLTPSPALVGHAVRFNAGSSSDPDLRATITDYLWKFGDGHTQAGIDPTHFYAKAGTYTVELIVADTRGASSSTIRTIVVDKQTITSVESAVKPAFSSAASATFADGSSERFPITAVGEPSPTITELGTLPSGVSFVGSMLRGTPTAAGRFPLTFTATNSAGSATQVFTLEVLAKGITVEPPIGSTVSVTSTQGTVGGGASTDTSTTTTSVSASTRPPAGSKPAFTSAEGAAFEYGREERFPVTASGEPTPTITLSGRLPEGVRFVQGALVGAARQFGTYTLGFTASNRAGSTTQTFVLKIVEPSPPSP
jgi:PKD repeat protein